MVDPHNLIEKYGADTARLFTLFASPPERDLDWSDLGVEGSYRFLNRVWNLVYETVNKRWPKAEANKEINFWIHKTIKKVTEDIENFHFNTAIAAVMEYVNFLYKIAAESGLHPDFHAALKTLSVLLYPLVPHFAEELAMVLGIENGLAQTTWPDYDHSYLKQDSINMVVQVNGKLRAQLLVPNDAGETVVKQMALEHEKMALFLKDKTILKTIYVPGRLVNFVVKQ
ncbi:MAG: leucyl-tRNA synthetase [uncultured bacterium]|nr:MAG: leucyl-tRNA synthetase [uncultured bacterium]